MYSTLTGCMSSLYSRAMRLNTGIASRAFCSISSARCRSSSVATRFTGFRGLFSFLMSS